MALTFPWSRTPEAEPPADHATHPMHDVRPAGRPGAGRPVLRMRPAPLVRVRRNLDHTHRPARTRRAPLRRLRHQPRPGRAAPHGAVLMHAATLDRPPDPLDARCRKCGRPGAVVAPPAGTRCAGCRRRLKGRCGCDWTERVSTAAPTTYWCPGCARAHDQHDAPRIARPPSAPAPRPRPRPPGAGPQTHPRTSCPARPGGRRRGSPEGPGTWPRPVTDRTGRGHTIGGSHAGQQEVQLDAQAAPGSVASHRGHGYYPVCPVRGAYCRWCTLGFGTFRFGPHTIQRARASRMQQSDEQTSRSTPTITAAETCEQMVSDNHSAHEQRRAALTMPRNPRPVFPIGGLIHPQRPCGFLCPGGVPAGHGAYSIKRGDHCLPFLGVALKWVRGES